MSKQRRKLGGRKASRYQPSWQADYRPGSVIYENFLQGRGWLPGASEPPLVLRGREQIDRLSAQRAAKEAEMAARAAQQAAEQAAKRPSQLISQALDVAYEEEIRYAERVLKNTFNPSYVRTGMGPSAFGSSDVGDVVRRLVSSQMMGARQPLISSLSEKFGPSRKELKAALEIEFKTQFDKTGELFARYADLFESGSGTVFNVTSAGNVSVQFGGKRIHLPAFNPYAQDVMLGGVRYAPLKHAVWDQAERKTRIISAQESLFQTLDELNKSGIKQLSESERGKAIRKALNNWAKKGLQHLRYGRTTVGGTQAYFLSRQVAIADTSHPALQLAHRVEKYMGEAVKEVFQFPQTVSTAGLPEGTAGIPTYLLNVRRALQSQLALGLVALEEGGYIGKEAIKSTGGKAFELRGIGAFESDAGRRMGSDKPGRIIGSTLDPTELGLMSPWDLLTKGQHHRRALMGLEIKRVQGIKRGAASIFGMGSFGTSNVLPALETDVDIRLRRMASAAFYRSGIVSEGMVDTTFAVTGGLLRARPGATEGQQKAAARIVSALFGDASIAPTSRTMLGITGEHARYRMARVAHSALPGEYADFQMHPLIKDALRKSGVGGEVSLAAPITFEDLIKHQVPAARERAVDRVKKIAIGYNLTSTGAKGSAVYLRRGESISAMRSGPGGTQFVIDTGQSRSRIGTPLIIGGTRRVSTTSALLMPETGIDFLAAAGKTGSELTDPHSFLEHTIRRFVETKNKKGLSEIANVLGGKVVKRFGETAISTDRRLELFPLVGGSPGTRPRKDLSKIAEVSRIAHKYGMMPELTPDTLKRLEAGDVSVIPQLYEDTGLTPEMAQVIRKRLTETMGAKELQELYKQAGTTDLRKILSTVVKRDVMSIRAGQPSRGSWGRVAMRLRDLRMYAVQTAAAGGANLFKMYHTDRALKDVLNPLSPMAKRMGELDIEAGRLRGLGLGEEQIEKLGFSSKLVSESLKQYDMMFRRSVESGSGIEEYMKAMFDAQSGDVSKLGTGYRKMTLAEFRAEYKGRIRLTKHGKLPHGSDLSALGGTPFVTYKDGKFVPTTETIVVEMPSEGYVGQVSPVPNKYTGKMPDLTGVRTKHVVLSSGQAIGLTEDELVRMTKPTHMQTGFGNTMLGLYESLMADDIEGNLNIYRAQTTAYLAAGETMFRKGGPLERGGKRLSTSFTGTMTGHSGLAAGEIGLTRKNVRKFLKRHGFKGEELEKRLSDIASGKADFYTNVKTEPMRSASHLSIGKVRIIDEVYGENADDVVFINQADLHIRQRDFDYDPIYLFNLAKRDAKGPNPLTAFEYEQLSLKFLFSTAQPEYLAIRQAGEQIAAKNMLKEWGAKQAGTQNTQIEEMLRAAITEAEEMLGRKMNVTATSSEMALAQAMARVQGLVTPIANVRWRTKMNLLQDLALGRDIKSFLLKGADESTSAALREAFNWFEGVDQFGVSRMQSIARLHVLAETSEYAFLKKAFSEKAFRTIADFAAQPDTIFSALTASLKIGQYVPGSTGPDSAETMVDRIQKYLGDLLDDAQGKNVEVWDQLVSPEIRAQILSKGGSSKDYVIRQMAEAFQAVSFLDQQGLKSSYESLTQWVVNQGDTAIDAAGIGQQWAKLMLGRSADFGNRLLTDASGWYGNVSNFIKESQAAAESGTAKLSQSLSGFSRKFLELVKEHPGKTAIGVGALAAYAIANSVGNSFSGADTDGMSGAPLPPSPLLRAGGSEPTIDFENHSMHEFARIERVPQVRTHAQISGQTGGVDFRGLSNRALYSRGRTPNHTGTFISDAGQMKDRARVEAEIRDRMNAEF